MSQTRKGSLTEALINVLIGFGINYLANLLILPAFGFKSLTLEQNLYIGLIYTGISIARSYIIRRWFNQHIVTAAAKLSGN